MKKVGILTHYYDSVNYGGVLQAYALCKTINKMQGYYAEQINYNFYYSDILPYAEKKLNLFQKIGKIGLKGIFSKINKKLIAKRNRKNKLRNLYMSKKREDFSSFKENINSSKSIFCKDDIHLASELYDCFITGSDQVWNLAWYHKAFFLDFVSSEKPKISYGASISMPCLTDNQKQIFKNSLRDFKAISLREKSSVSLIQDLVSKDVEVVLDPTLLLSKEEWNEVCEDRLIEDKYVFCYFLGNNSKAGKLAKEYAKKFGYKLVSIPFASDVMSYYDDKFGDINIFDAGPQKFLSLVKHAECIFTDSFHATVFSNIFCKEFFVFNRNPSGEMSGRIYDITELFGCENRFCYGGDKLKLSYLLSQEKLDYDKENSNFIKLKDKSLKFIKDNI
ncbi:MAG: polysaccharide pyruvyl transferase family protein [Clostridiales bacterium]|nr:polysaccharide pyruvyl transferase family protein [Clostridiales bacterium]